eukprot:gene9494-10486_t
MAGGEGLVQYDGVEIDDTVELSEEEQQAIQEFILEVNKENALGEFHEVDDQIALRFLRARKFDVDRAVALFIAHKNVRVKFDLKHVDISKDPFRSELFSGKFTVLPGKDLAGATVCLFTERLHFPDKTTHQAVLKSVIFQLDEVTKRDDAQINGLVLIYDMKWASYRNFDYDLCMKTLSLLKGAFPARLKHVYVLSAPFWFRATLTILSGFLREKIRDRVEVLKSSQDLLARIPASTLPMHLGGDHLLDHDAWLDICVDIHNRSLSKGETAIKLKGHVDTSAKGFSFQHGVAGHTGNDEIVEAESDNSPSRSMLELVNYINEVGWDGICEEYRIIKSQPPLGTFRYSGHPFNMVKNRYKDVLCYDHSRVKLAVMDENDMANQLMNAIGLRTIVQGREISVWENMFSDYINASYVSGFLNGMEQQNAYICTQGPLKSTVCDFWRMVLENQVHVIVMITRCHEKGKEKCYKYWPDVDGVMECGFMKIKNLSETREDDYVIRNLQLHHKKRGEDLARKVTHVQFTSWPDFGVLSSAEKFLNILEKVQNFQNSMPGSDSDICQEADKQRSRQKHSPIVLHCSAGIGRSGTYIAIDKSLRAFDSHGTINLPLVAREIRRQRAFCIQTEEQYAFCYTALLQHILIKLVESGRDKDALVVENCLQQWLGSSTHNQPW